MRFAVVMAGTAGFVLILAMNLMLEKAPGQSLIHATVAAAVFALFGHWWLKLWTSSLQEAQEERAQKAAAESEKAQQEAAAAVPKPAGTNRIK